MMLPQHQKMWEIVILVGCFDSWDGLCALGMTLIILKKEV